MWCKRTIYKWSNEINSKLIYYAAISIATQVNNYIYEHNTTHLRKQKIIENIFIVNVLFF